MLNTPKYAMACGHVSNAFRSDESGNHIPVCLECFGSLGTKLAAQTIADLKNRIAKCKGNCDRFKPSDPLLPFFSYNASGEYDSYYDGCQG